MFVRAEIDGGLATEAHQDSTLVVGVDVNPSVSELSREHPLRAAVPRRLVSQTELGGERRELLHRATMTRAP